MDSKELERWINELIAKNKIVKFYQSKHFVKVRKEVLNEQHRECQRCRSLGKLTIVKDKLNNGVVHHVKFVKKYPRLALSKYYTDEDGRRQRNLIVLCHECHEIVHGRACINKGEPLLNDEKW